MRERARRVFCSRSCSWWTRRCGCQRSGRARTCISPCSSSWPFTCAPTNDGAPLGFLGVLLWVARDRKRLTSPLVLMPLLFVLGYFGFAIPFEQSMAFVASTRAMLFASAAAGERILVPIVFMPYLTWELACQRATLITAEQATANAITSEPEWVLDVPEINATPRTRTYVAQLVNADGYPVWRTNGKAAPTAGGCTRMSGSGLTPPENSVDGRSGARQSTRGCRRARGGRAAFPAAWGHPDTTAEQAPSPC